MSIAGALFKRPPTCVLRCCPAYQTKILGEMLPQTDRESAVHLTAIRRALARRNAAVMVGAGFSRNAEGGERLSTWPQLSAELVRRLDPTADPSAFSIGTVTQLGEQFARVFSEPALEDFLKEMVPDERVRPGPLHDDLLRLEWSEIFTTNYDTLLERAAEKMFERAHFTVCSREDIPLSKVLGTRRIVKLHGSFPSQRPFIFTEEHYRTYPERFAPFVNLVRQSLLENVFCLVGFSGDDPNFLHWLGWVRDMLDGASLPVYLFLDRPPAFGQRRLLEARGVTPVVLPEADSGDPRDYAGRYRKLLNALAEPLERPALEWGAIHRASSARTGSETKDQQYALWLDDCEQLAALRRGYPGWLLAPRSVRQRFRLSTSRFVELLHEQWLRERLERESPTLRMALFALYAWQREVLLAPLDDEVAECALSLLPSTPTLQIDGSEDELRLQLHRFGVASLSDAKQQWQSLALSLLRWARQGLRDDKFDLVSRLLGNANDAFASDVISNERVHLLLQRAQRQKARDALTAWKVRSADPYMLVRHAVLTAEVGDIDGAIGACNAAIQQVRESQKIKPKDPLLVSQEAWACLITDRLQQGRNVWLPAELKSEEIAIEDLSERLQTLAARGYSPQRELEQVESALGAEAMASFERDHRFRTFDIGRTAPVRRFGLTSEFRAKMTAASEFLELAERTGLLPRMPGVQFHSWSYLQAAWWIQYNDSRARVHGILMRTVSLDALKPKDPTMPPHRTGWLSRFQVALFSSEEATEICLRLLAEVEDCVSRNAEHPDNRVAVAFELEVFSRLVVRIENPAVALELGERIVRFHQNAGLVQDSANWPHLATALKRCAEALPSTLVRNLIKAAASVSTPPQVSRRPHGWFHLTELLFEPAPPAPTTTELADWRPVVIAAAQALEKEQTSFNWAAFSALKALGMLTPEDQQRGSAVLWNGKTAWPTSQVLRPSAAFRWPAPPSGVDIRKAFAEWLRERPIAKFRVDAGGSFGKGWRGESDDHFLEAVVDAMECKSLTADDYGAVTKTIAAWWREEGAAILQVIPRLPEIGDDLDSRLDLVDQILWEGMCLLRSDRGFPTSGVEVGIRALVDAFVDAGRPLKRLSLQRSLEANDLVEANHQLHEIAHAFLGNNEMQIHISGAVVQSLIESADMFYAAQVEVIFDALAAAAMARRLPGTLRSMQLLANVALTRPSLLAERHWHACRAALELFAEELHYGSAARAHDVVDDGVPTHRFVCVQLADALRRSVSCVTNAEIIDHWLKAAASDPLPELRFSRFSIKN